VLNNAAEDNYSKGKEVEEGNYSKGKEVTEDKGLAEGSTMKRIMVRATNLFHFHEDACRMHSCKVILAPA
jgi:hypothetical protein